MKRRQQKPGRVSPQHGTRPYLFWAAILLLAVGAVYSNSLGGPFVADDDTAIVQNPAIRDWTDFGTIFARHSNTPLAGRPLVTLSFGWNYAVSGLDVWSYHLVNIALHALCALLLFGIVRRTLRSGCFRGAIPTAPSDPPYVESLSFAVALIWAVHPLATEAVNYTTQRTESLMALCLLTALYASIRSHASRWPGWAVLAVTACAAGMLCKETMVAAPVLIALYDRVFVDSSWKSWARRWRFYAALALSWGVLIYELLGAPRSGSVKMASSQGSWNYLLNQAQMIARYFRLSIWPSGLVMNYGPPRPLALGDVWPQALLITGLVVATSIALFVAPAAGFLGAWIFIILAPSSSVIPIITEVGAERRMYLPLMAVSCLAVTGVYSLAASRLALKPKTIVAASALVALLLGSATVLRNREYADELVLAQSVLKNWPTDVAHGMVGSALGSLKRDEEAVAELRLAARTDSRSRFNLGVELFNLQRFDEAVVALRRYIELDPNHELVPTAHAVLGDALAKQHKWDEAAAEYRIALSMRPKNASLSERLAAVLSSGGFELVQRGRLAEAATRFQEAVELAPGEPSLRHNLAAALLDSGNVAGAEREARTAIEISPGDADSYDLLGRALAHQGRLPEAMAAFETAIKLAPDDAQYRQDIERLR